MSHRFRLGLALPLVAACVLALPRVALAQDRPEPPSDEDALGTHQKNIRVDLGLRTQFVSSAGLDPFSENDVVPQFALGASWAFYAKEQLSLAAMFGFDYTSLESRARDNATSLDLARFTLGPEARYHLLRVLALTARVAPTLTRQSAEISAALGSDLHKVAWKLGFDATAGAAVELYGYRSGASRKPRLWATAEGGYGWTSATKMVFEPKEAGDVPQRLTPLELDDLSLSGPLFRLTVALSFW